jgi:hypothetical protein
MLTGRSLALRLVVLVFVLTLPNMAVATPQAPAAQPRAEAQAVTPSPAPPAIDVSLRRVRRMLRETPPTAPAKSPLANLEYYVQVVGESPRIDFFKDFNIGRASAVQYGGMTHAEFLKVTAPFWRKW